MKLYKTRNVSVGHGCTTKTALCQELWLCNHV